MLEIRFICLFTCTAFFLFSTVLLFTFILSFLGRLQISPLGAHEAAELAEREVRVLGLDDRPHLAAEQDVAAHVDLPLRALLLRQALKGFWCGLQDEKRSTALHIVFYSFADLYAFPIWLEHLYRWVGQHVQIAV